MSDKDKVYQCSCGETFGGVGAKIMAKAHERMGGNHIVKRVR